MSIATFLGGPADGARLFHHGEPFLWAGAGQASIDGAATMIATTKRSPGTGLYRHRTSGYYAFVGHFIVQCDGCGAFIGREGERPPEDCQLCGAGLPVVR